MEIDKIVKDKRDEILSITARHGAKNVRIFGSFAKGEANQKSDLDILVQTETVTSPWFPAGLVLELEELLGLKVDVVTEKALHWYIKEKIFKEAIHL